MAIHVTNFRRAFCLVYQGFARIVNDDLSTFDFASWLEHSQRVNNADKAGIYYISTPTYRVRVPDVIQLVKYARVPPRRVKFSRRNIFLRDNFTCQYCGRKPALAELTIDHVIPKSRGGRSTWDNVVLSCIKCNTRKGSFLPAELDMPLMSKPRRPHWLSCTMQEMVHKNRPMWMKFLDQTTVGVGAEE